MKKKLIVLSGFVLSLAPVSVFAASAGCNVGPVNGLKAVLCKIEDLLNAVVPVLIALAVVWFVWGVISYMIGDDEEAKKKGRDRVIYGIIGFAVIVAMWGLVNILTDTFQLTGSNNTNVILPTGATVQQ
jgi:hypothetical protein